MVEHPPVFRWDAIARAAAVPAHPINAHTCRAIGGVVRALDQGSASFDAIEGSSMLGESRSVIREPDGANARRQQENDEHRHDSCRERDCDAGESLPELDEDEPRGGEPHDDAREGDGWGGV